MELIWKKEYKSIKQFNPIELPQFTILTGVNGSGKTQLCEAINNDFIGIRGYKSPEIIFYNYSSFKVTFSEAAQTRNLIQEKKSAFIQYDGMKKNITSSPNYKLEVEIKRSEENFRKGIDYIILKTGKKLNELIELDFLDFYQTEDKTIFSQLEKIFKDYHIKFEKNKIQRFYEEGNKIPKEKRRGLIDEEFFVKYGEKPWNLVEKILKKFSDFDYEISNPEGTDIDEGFRLTFKSSIQSGVNITSEDLSSGEKTLLALVVSLYSSEAKREFPKVLLLDEIDASLHPSMTQKTLELLHDIFVIKKEMKVLITTHSPSTIAFACTSSLGKPRFHR